MEWQIGNDRAETECAAAEFIAARLSAALESRKHATLAISGGRSPWGMLVQLAEQPLEWKRVHVFQVDERIVPLEDDARNWRRFLVSPLARNIPESNRHPIPVELEDPELATGKYSATLAQWADVPPQLDVVHLGLGEDGHTASLFAGDPLLEDRRHWVGVSRAHQGYRRITLTLPVLDHARTIVWFAVGAGRREVLGRLHAADPAIPASHVRRDRALCFTDREAAGRDS